MATSSKKTIDDDVMTVLKKSTITGTALKLPPGQLERKLYERVNKVLTLAGGKWNRSAGAHVFTKDPREVLGLAMEQGHLVDKKVENQQFFTPPEVAKRMIVAAQYGSTPLAERTILEPSCGAGNLLRAVIDAGANPRLISAIELDPELATSTQREFPGVDVVQGDFMKEHRVRSRDLILMNPPFSNRQDIDHVTRALDHLKPGGRVVAIMSPYFQYGETKKAVAFRELLDEHDSEVEELPESAFASSGTQVRTVMVTIDMR